MSSHEKLSAAANDRKSRLAQLKSLKRKQEQISDAPEATDSSPSAQLQTETSQALTRTEDDDEKPSIAATYLSGRNYDATTRNVKLGFDNLPISDPTNTLEYKAEQLALETKAQQDAEKAEDKGLDLFKLQPKKPNWDLKRDLDQKMKGLQVQTDNAIAKLVRERVEAQKAIREKQPTDGSNGEEVGMEGSELVEAMHLKEQEEERERKRDAEEEDTSNSMMSNLNAQNEGRVMLDADFTSIRRTL
ncbi:cell cycle control protein cwf18 [Stemphylium lycopersici]|uniref:Cell cycle control protein cwf18 n=1 Tax=Stemphylium lycopersici TaxID=183478 RepID=A0A364NC48_STELY|nr:cell cycle control protein cwf18 [Stemphylium lycopersici]